MRSVNPGLLMYAACLGWLVCNEHDNILLFLAFFNLGCWAYEMILRWRSSKPKPNERNTET